MISASIMAANMWKNSLKNVESDNNKILYETLLDCFVQRNGTYCLNKPRMWKVLMMEWISMYCNILYSRNLLSHQRRLDCGW